MEAVDALLAIEAIKILKARYFRAVDAQDWGAMSKLLDDDFVCDLGEAWTDPESGHNFMPGTVFEVLRGKDVALAAFEAGMKAKRSVHRGYMPEIEIIGPAAARGIWAMIDRMRLLVDGTRTELIGYGHYHETYRKTDGTWKVATLKLSRQRVDAVS